MRAPSRSYRAGSLIISTTWLARVATVRQRAARPPASVAPRAVRGAAPRAPPPWTRRCPPRPRRSPSRSGAPSPPGSRCAAPRPAPAVSTTPRDARARCRKRGLGAGVGARTLSSLAEFSAKYAARLAAPSMIHGLLSSIPKNPRAPCHRPVRTDTPALGRASIRDGPPRRVRDRHALRPYPGSKTWCRSLSSDQRASVAHRRSVEA